MDTYTNNGLAMLKGWFEKATRWQKDLFAHIWNGGMTEDEIFTRAIKLIEQEHLDENHRVAAVTTFPSDITFGNAAGKRVMLTQISNIKGIGALAPREPLSFGDGLTVVYGQNGCGKSSYVRILKALANPVNADAVFGNVYRKDQEEPEATAIFTIDGDPQSVVWNKASKKKHPIQIYDTLEADRFVNKENEVVYEPKVLATITQMAAMYDRLSKHFAQIEEDAEQKMPKLPQELMFNSTAAEFAALSTRDGLNCFIKMHPWTDAEIGELSGIEAALRENDPKQAAKARTAQRDIIRNHGYEILKLLDYVSDEVRSDYLEKRERQIATKKIADLLVASSTGHSLLQEFGGDIWKTMWARATEYVRAAEGSADKPVTGFGRCALCQQELDEEATERMKSFQAFSQSSAITESEVARLDFKAAVKTLQDHVENKIDLSERKTALQSSSIASDSQEFILSLYESILARCGWLLSYHDDTDTEIPYIQSRDEIIAAFSAMVEKLNSEIKVLQTIVESRDKLIPRMQELVVSRWAHDNLGLKQRLILLKSVITKCRTNTLTTLKKDLSKLLITDAYINRFQEEMNRLDTRKQIKVELVANAPRRGRSYHQVVLKDACAMGKHKNNEILSEGEFRVVSLAAFLSDLSSWNRNLPFIFDDPITSLDHLYENSVAKRLIELSMERQVIVFTHRLAFAQLLESAASEFNAACAIAGHVTRAQIKHIELRNSPLGHPSDPNYVGKMKLESAVKNLLNRDVPAIKKELKDGRFSDSDAKTLALCAEFRNMIEYGVEQNLLCGVVSRFSRNVSTMKLPCLYAITQEDISLFDSMMTKYSYYDHSHSIETPLPPPQIEDIEADLIRMRDWANAFTKRSEAEQKKAKGK